MKKISGNDSSITYQIIWVKYHYHDKITVTTHKLPYMATDTV